MKAAFHGTVFDVAWFSSFMSAKSCVSRTAGGGVSSGVVGDVRYTPSTVLFALTFQLCDEVPVELFDKLLDDHTVLVVVSSS
jgi:hypothetical protein